MMDQTSPQSPDLEFVAGRWLEPNPPQGEPPHPGWEWSGEWTLDGPPGPDGRRTGRAQGGKWVPPSLLKEGAAYYAEHAQSPVQETGYADGGMVLPSEHLPDPSEFVRRSPWTGAETIRGIPTGDRRGELPTASAWADHVSDLLAPMVRDAVTTAERLMEAERLASDASHETGGSPEWAAVVAELLDHQGVGVLKQKICILCPTLDDPPTAPGSQHGDQADPPTAETAKTGVVVPPEPEQQDNSPSGAVRPRGDRPGPAGWPQITCGDCRAKAPFDA